MLLDLIQSNILDTDIATHLRKMTDLQQMGLGIYMHVLTYNLLMDVLIILQMATIHLTLITTS